MSGWCPTVSASSPTRLVKSRARRKFLKRYSFSRWCASTTLQSPPSRARSPSISAPLSGGTPPLQGMHSSFASSLIVDHLSLPDTTAHGHSRIGYYPAVRAPSTERPRDRAFVLGGGREPGSTGLASDGAKGVSDAC